MRLPPRASAFLCAVALVAMGCEKPPPRTPEGAYRTFAEALRRGDSRAAWATLSTATRKLVEARSKQLSEASKGAIRDEPSLLLLQSGTRPGEIGEVKVLSSDGDAAVLEVGAPSERQQIHMVREGDHWTVELSDILRETP